MSRDSEFTNCHLLTNRRMNIKSCSTYGFLNAKTCIYLSNFDNKQDIKKCNSYEIIVDSNDGIQTYLKSRHGDGDISEDFIRIYMSGWKNFKNKNSCFRICNHKKVVLILLIFLMLCVWA